MGDYRIVSDVKRDRYNTESVKDFFIRRDFRNIVAELEKKNNDGENIIINKALAYHVLGNYDEAKKYYAKLKNNISDVNYLAFCHRYFDYKNFSPSNFSDNQYKTAWYNNYFNYLVTTNGIEVIAKKNVQHSIYTEQIVNDLFLKMGKDMLHEQNDILKDNYLSNVDIQAQKTVLNNKIKIGIFVTDIQRHKDSAIIYELVECLKDKFEIIIYFNNIFANKLAKIFESICIVRYVVSMYYEEINNILYEDKIDILIDMAELGLRNNNIALSLVTKSISLHELLFEYPMLLKTDLYFSYEKSENQENITCVIGDLKCLSNEELIRINEQINGKIVFESHSLDEYIFRNYFARRISELGYDMERVELKPGILPFSRYMNYITSCKNIVITSGASYVELAEAIKCHTNIILMSENPLIRKAYGMYCNKDMEVISDSVRSVRQQLIQFIYESGKSELYRVKNKKSRIAYFEQGKEMVINNTCNGDIILLGE